MDLTLFEVRCGFESEGTYMADMMAGIMGGVK
jgi:hypothetical protein